VLCDLPWGGVIQEGSTVVAYSEAAPIGNSTTACNSHKETRTCTGGVLSGTYTIQTCVNPATEEEAIRRILVKNAGKTYTGSFYEGGVVTGLGGGNVCPPYTNGSGEDCRAFTATTLNITVPATPNSQVQAATWLYSWISIFSFSMSPPIPSGTAPPNYYEGGLTSYAAVSGQEFWTQVGYVGVYTSQPSGGYIWKHWAQGSCLNGLTTPVLENSNWTSVVILSCQACIQQINPVGSSAICAPMTSPIRIN
jgi:hypothetical protein